MGEHAAVEKLDHDIQLTFVAGILEPVSREYDLVPERNFTLSERHVCHNKAELYCKWLNLAFIESVPFIFIEVVLQYFLIYTEIAEHIIFYMLHL